MNAIIRFSETHKPQSKNRNHKPSTIFAISTFGLGYFLNKVFNMRPLHKYE